MDAPREKYLTPGGNSHRNMSDNLWTEKYRPSKLDDVIGNQRAKTSMREWAKGWSGKEAPAVRAIILAGPPGVGKTTCAIALAKEMSWDYIEMNASDKRTGKELKRIVIPGASTNTFSPDGTYFSLDESKRHVIILDEADNIDSRDDIGGIAAVSELLKVTLQPVVLIVNDLYELTRRSESIKKACKVIRFEGLKREELARVLHDIGEAEKIGIGYEAALKLVDMAGGDARAAINDLQSIAVRDSVTIKDLASLSKRNKTIDIKEGIERLFGSDDIRESLRMITLLDEDPSGLLLWVDENMPANATNIETLSQGLDALADASRFVRLAGRHSYYRLWSYANNMTVIGSKMASKGYDHREEARFPLVLTRFRRRNAVMAVKKGLVAKVSAYAHTSPRNVSDAILPFMKNSFRFSDRFAAAMTSRLALTVEELAVLLDEAEDSRIVTRIVKLANSSAE